MERPGSQLTVAVKQNRPAWQRLTRTISQTFGRKTRKASSLSGVPVVSLPAAAPASKTLNRSAATQVSFASASRIDVDGDASMEDNEGERQRAERDDIVGVKVFSPNSIVDAIPVEFPLVQYVAECCLLLRHDPSFRPSDSDVETRLFFKCVELEKWTLAHTLAEKMQRSMARCLREWREPSDRRPAEDRIHRADRASELCDDQDVVLQFLNTCAS